MLPTVLSKSPSVSRSRNICCFQILNKNNLVIVIHNCVETREARYYKTKELGYN